ncbi:MAG: hypothetical protein LW636_04670 [Planctomycetaceae bacterium]|nr:hypothetical protein [Planctomycetaceae bacterium]
MGIVRSNFGSWATAVIVSLVFAAAAWARQDAAGEYDRLGALFAEYESDPQSPWVVEWDSESDFLRKGVVDDSMRAWLERARPLVPDLLRATDLPYRRALDREQGFAMLLPHLSQHRTMARALRVLMVDARRNDPARFASLLRAQARLGERAAEDGTLISSLVAMSIGSLGRGELEGMLSRGEIDGALAREALDATAGISQRRDLRISDAMENERAALALEMNRITELSGEERGGRIDLLTGHLDGGDGALAAAFSDEALAAFPAQHAAYGEAMQRILEAPDAASARAEAERLDRAAEAGEFGALHRLLAPAISRVVERAWSYEESWESLRADLNALADGTKQPSDFMNAAVHYMRASAAAMQLRVDEQDDIDAVRRGARALPEELRASARTMLVRLEPSIAAELLAGSRCGRLRFAGDALERLDVSPTGADDFGLVLLTQPGINGAVRTMLAAALLPEVPVSGLHPKPVAPAQELASAAVRIAGHYATTGRMAHAIAARHMLRDAADALEVLDAEGRIDAEGRASLDAALARLDAADPLGLRRASERERSLLEDWQVLAAKTEPFMSVADAPIVAVAEPARYERLSANELLFLTAVAAGVPVGLRAEDCSCPLHGPLIDMRPWFDGAAIEKVAAARTRVVERARTLLERDAKPSSETDRARPTLQGSPLEGLDVAPPVELVRLATDAAADIARLRAIASRR